MNGFRVFAEQKLIESVGSVIVDYTVTAFGEGFKISGGNESENKECGSCSC